MIDTISKWLLFIACVATILVAGWKQPLRYRFMSPAEIYAVENPRVVGPTPSTWMQDPTRRTLLDGGPYGGRRGPGAARIYDPTRLPTTPYPYR